MAGTIWLFIDEFGNVKFGQNGSKYFGLASIATEDPDGLAAGMDALRHRWWLDGHIARGYFHAREDCWPVRQAVFEGFKHLPIVRSDVIALAKNAILKDRQPPGLLYRTGVRELLRFVMPQLAHNDRAFVVTADLRPLIDDVASIVHEALTVELWDGHHVWSRPLQVVQASAGVHPGVSSQTMSRGPAIVGECSTTQRG